MDQVLSSASNSLILIAIARIFTPAEFGTFAVWFAVVVGLMSTLRGLLGTPLSLLQDPQQIRAEASYGVVVAFLAGSLLTAALVVTSLLTESRYLIILAVAVPIALMQDCLRFAAMSKMRASSALISDLLWFLFSAGALTATVIRSDVSIEGIILLWALGAICGLAYLLFVLGVRPRFIGLAGWISSGWRTRVSFAVDYGVAAVSSVVYISVISVIMGTVAAGALRGAGTIMGPLSIVFGSLPMVLVPILVRSGMTSRATVRRYSFLGLGLALVALSVGVLGYLLPGWVGTQILGETWVDTRMILILVGIEYMAQALSAVARALLRAQGAASELLKIRFVFTTAMLISGFTLAWTGDIRYVASGMAAVAWISAIYAIYLTWRVMHKNGSSQIAWARLRWPHTATADYGRRVLLAPLIWMLLGLLANIPNVVFYGSDTSQVLISAVGIAHCCYGFVQNGGNRISVPGVFLFGSGLFVFFPGVYMYYFDPFSHGPLAAISALNIAYLIQVILYHYVWNRGARTQSIVEKDPVRYTDLSWGAWVGVTLATVGVIGSLAGVSLAGFSNAAAFSGIILFCVSAYRTPRRSYSWILYVFVGILFLAYSSFVFTGFGRLQLGTLGIAIAMTVSHRWSRRGVKIGILLAAAPVLLYLAQSRVEFTARLNPNQSADADGFSSVVGPFARFAESLHIYSTGGLPELGGLPYFASLVALVPRSIWPEKPEGFGAMLAQFFRPELNGTGHSEAALHYGEWLFSFGLLSMMYLAVAVGFAVWALDRLMVKFTSASLWDRRGILTVSGIVILASGILDFVWGGSFTFVARIGPRLVVLLVLWLIFVSGPGRRSVPDIETGRRKDNGGRIEVHRPASGNQSDHCRAGHRLISNV
ncbi:MATE family efflux transporter [Rhodococcus rhodochrous]|uniref:hypothetical protein n=1 Tax=Rhodococcus rhodochrous TaxID=1829 RepID=UPI0017829E68|nr:hypothetical protein [Rhodococcus rhodochrous]